MRSTKFEKPPREDNNEPEVTHYLKATFTGIRCDSIEKRIQKMKLNSAKRFGKKFTPKSERKGDECSYFDR